MFYLGKAALQHVFTRIKELLDGKADKKYVDDRLQEAGTISYAAFHVEDGNLIMENDIDKTHTDFRLENGNLIVEVIG